LPSPSLGSEDEWRQIDKKVNTYPCQRHFTAIGTCIDGGVEFQRECVRAVESVAGVVHVECLSQRTSKEGRYISVRIGPVWVENGDQVIAIYAELKRRGEELAHKGAGKLKYLI
jgi:putative lipoic acid-binding regulatory protein